MKNNSKKKNSKKELSQNPELFKIKSDYEFCRLLNSLWNSGSGKSVPFISAEASQSDRLIENISFC
jgi:hypothetical protein